VLTIVADVTNRRSPNGDLSKKITVTEGEIAGLEHRQYDGESALRCSPPR